MTTTPTTDELHRVLSDPRNGLRSEGYYRVWVGTVVHCHADTLGEALRAAAEYDAGRTCPERDPVSVSDALGGQYDDPEWTYDCAAVDARVIPAVDALRGLLTPNRHERRAAASRARQEVQ